MISAKVSSDVSQTTIEISAIVSSDVSRTMIEILTKVSSDVLRTSIEISAKVSCFYRTEDVCNNAKKIRNVMVMVLLTRIIYRQTIRI